jgi:hypothetical protein
MDDKILKTISTNFMVSYLVASFEITAVKSKGLPPTEEGEELMKVFDGHAETLLKSLDTAGFQIVNKVPEPFLR